MGIIDGSTAVLTAKNLYSFVKTIQVPNVGDLRDPVTFYREDRKPQKGPDGLYTLDAKDDITPYHNAWAFVWQSQQAMLAGQNVQNTISHVFIVRAFPHFMPEVRDGIVWQGRMHSVLGTRNIEKDRHKRFLVVLANAEGLYVDEPRDDTTKPGVETPDQYEGMDDPLWL